MDLEEFCRKLPKIELHAHLNGSLSEETLSLLNVPKELLSTYQLRNTVSANTPETLDLCFKLFKVAHDATFNVEAIYKATKHVIEDFYRDNVIYLEIRTTPRQEQNMTKKQYIESVVKAISDNQYPIIVKLILSIDRSHSLQTSQEALDLIVEMHKKHPDIIVGVDLSGNPNKNEFFEELFIKARKNGLFITLHCGEVKNNYEVLNMLNFKPDRIGHGTCIHFNYGGSTKTWDLYKSLEIPVECCLTSNVLCATSESYKKHHVREWIKNNLPFCINTDDKGVFNTSLSHEFCYLMENQNINREEIVKLCQSTIKYCFATDNEKERLRDFYSYWLRENPISLVDDLNS